MADGGGSSVYAQTTVDYDDDNDGLIDVRTLAQLDAIRHDLDGNGAPSSGGASAYGTAFPNRVTSASGRMGCPSGNCAGYELRADLDFDTDGDGSTYTGSGASATSDSGDAYHNSGAGWAPIGTFTATFKGNGHAISNLFIKRTSIFDVIGMFSFTASSTRIETVGLVDAYVHGGAYVGGLVGRNRGTVAASYIAGEVRGTHTTIGGLVGYNDGAGAHAGAIVASYSTAAVAGGSAANVGGLVGFAASGSSISASYSIGTVSTTGSGRGGFVGSGTFSGADPATISASYWDTVTTSIADDNDNNAPEGETSNKLKSVTSYTDIYADWNVDVDGAAGNDDPWDFGTTSEYPALKFGGMDPHIQRGDYDHDNDGLIEIRSLAQLDAVRHDLNGNGDATAAAYAAAFPRRNTTSANRMGCPSGTCSGYELAAHLDFDTDGDGSTYIGTGSSASGDSGDAYYNSNAGFARIGSDTSGSQYEATFKGNGYTISNLFIRSATLGENDRGLFGATSSSARIESVFLIDPYVRGNLYVGALVGSNRGTVTSSYTSGGNVYGFSYVGGLVGYNYGTVRAAYSTTAAGGTGGPIAGLIGRQDTGATVSASYAAGSVTVDFGSSRLGFVGQVSGTIENCYWDTNATGIGDDGDSNMPEGKTRTKLQSETSYTDIYANWNVDADGTSGSDDPWDFGTSSQYPALKYGGMDPYTQRGDYDSDDDGLIEITTLDRLNAVRWDLDGDAVKDTTSDADWEKHNAAFFNADASMGCPDTAADADSDPGPCTGYELAADLDFDADGDGDVDANDPYPNWTPVGDSTNGYAAAFDGNNYDISNLTIARTANADDVGLFGRAASTAVISGVGLPDASVTSSGSGASLYIGALVGYMSGTVRSSYSTGTVSQTGTGNFGFVGGLTGYLPTGSTVAASWSGAHVSSSGPSTAAGGITGRLNGGTIRAAYSAGVISATGDGAYAGGAGGVLHAGSLAAFYAIGPSTSTGTSGEAHPIGSGIAGASPPSNPTITAAYWDVGTADVADDSDTVSPEGKTTSELSSPTAYGATGIYSTWDMNVDGVSGNDDPWDFGQGMQYPMLKFDGMSVVAQGSLAMGMPSSNNNHPVVGSDSQVCLVSGPSIRAAGTRNGKAPWVWQRSTDGKTWADITEDGGPTWRYTPVSGDVGNYLRACVALGDNAPEGADEACVRMFAKTKAAGG